MHGPHSYQPASTDGELLPIVDENDVVVGAATRREVHQRSLRHRAVHCVVTDGAGRVLFQLRSPRKDMYPGWWDISMGGHVNAGEEYEAAVLRELREELGIAAPEAVREVARKPPTPLSGWEFVRIYECVHTGALAPDPEEVVAAHWADARDVLAGAPVDPAAPARGVTPSGLDSIRLWATATGLLPPEPPPRA